MGSVSVNCAGGLLRTFFMVLPGACAMWRAGACRRLGRFEPVDILRERGRAGSSLLVSSSVRFVLVGWADVFRSSRCLDPCAQGRLARYLAQRGWASVRVLAHRPSPFAHRPSPFALRPWGGRASVDLLGRLEGGWMGALEASRWSDLCALGIERSIRKRSRVLAGLSFVTTFILRSIKYGVSCAVC